MSGFCSFCGAAHREAGWPRTCPACARVSYRNPIPVAVALVPVRGQGLVVIERGIEPQLGQLALPGGYVDWQETWQEGAAREVREETGIELDPAAITPFDVQSAPGGLVLIFGLAAELDPAALPPFRPTHETRARRVLEQPAPLAFPLHTRAAADWFARR